MSLPQLLNVNGMYQDDQLSVYCGECSSILSLLPDDCIDLTVTSPPYDNLRKYNGYLFPFDDIAKQLFRVTKQGGVVVWIVGDKVDKGSETGSSFRQVLGFKSVGFLLHDTMIYVKDSIPAPQSNRYNQMFEYMFVLSKGKPSVFNPIEVRSKGYKPSKTSTKRYPDGHTEPLKYEQGKMYRTDGNVWFYVTGYMKSAKERYVFDHPAIFPEDLARDHILSWSDKGAVVLDPMCGSGTTLKMSLLEGRRSIGIDIIDISEDYCSLSVIRCLKALSSKEVGG